MLPTLADHGDGVLISTFHRRGRGVKVGDCVDFKHPLVPGAGAIKRVIGMPGDFVESQNGPVEMDANGQLWKHTGMMIQVFEITSNSALCDYEHQTDVFIGSRGPLLVAG